MMRIIGRTSVALGAMALVTAGCSSLGSTSVTSKPDGTAASASVSRANSAAAAPRVSASTVARVGSTITLHGTDDGEVIAVTLLKFDVAAKSTNQFAKPSAGMVYVAAKVQLQNVGTKAFSDSPSNGAKLIDKDAQSYSASLSGEVSTGPDLGSPKIAVGNRAVGVIVFEVPPRINLQRFQLTLDSGFAQQSGEWQL